MIIGLYTIGGTPDPIALSLDENKIDFAYFFCSNEYVDKIGEIKQLTLNKKIFENNELDVIRLEDPQNPTTCFNEILEIVQKIKYKSNFDKVIVDITGGTKAMTAALMSATAGNGFVYCYVGSISKCGRDKETGRVKKEFMKVYTFEDPYIVYHEKEKDIIVNFFNSYNYSGVINVISTISLITNEEDIFNGISKIAKGYSEWELFNHKFALNDLKEGINKLKTALKYKSIEQLSIFCKDVENNINFLSGVINHLYQKNDKINIFKDIYFNSVRRAEEGKYDDAVARLYSCIEQFFSSELDKLGIDSSNVDINKIPQELKEEYESIRDNEGKIKIGLLKKIKLLSYLGNKYADLVYNKSKNELKQEFKEIMNARNYSILAHGTNPISKEQYEKFRNIVKELLEIKEELKFAKIIRW